MNELEGGNMFSGLFRNKNKHTQAEIEAFGGPNTAEKASEYFARPTPTTPNADNQQDELSDDERVSSFVSNTSDMSLDERLPELINTLRSIQDDKNFDKALNALPPSVIKKLPMDIIGRRARLGGRKSRRGSRKRHLKRTLKRKGGKGKGRGRTKGKGRR